jgi:hypothetical protein
MADESLPDLSPAALSRLVAGMPLTLGVRISLQYRQLPDWDSNHQQAA